MQTIFYKVVKTFGSGLYMSTFMDHHPLLGRTYQKDQITTGYQGSYLYVFRSLESAMRWAQVESRESKGCYGIDILVCMCMPISNFARRNFYSSRCLMQPTPQKVQAFFWTGNIPTEYEFLCMMTPEGTEAVESVLPLAKIHDTIARWS